MKLTRRLARRFSAVAALMLFAGCGGMDEAMTAHTNVVARAAGKELRVEETARLLSLNPQIPADPEVVRALADIWVDYMLLATAVAEDTTLAAVDLEVFTEPAREQILMVKLREQVIQPDTLFDEAELERRWATEGPGAEIRARHILLRLPAEATPAQRDSIRRLAESLRERAQQGEDFAALATEHSEDPGSAVRGGDLGFFGRGRMVAPFEEAAFQLQPGEVSEVVESPFGYHIIRLEERRQPELGTGREEFRQFLVRQSAQEAEEAYLDSLSTAANVEVRPGGLAVVREIANRPEVNLRGRAANREIATYEGGALTSGKFAQFIRTQPAQVQSAFSTATDDQLETAVEQLTRRELLLDQARRRNVTLTRAEEDSVRNEARAAIRELVEVSGFAEGARQRADAAGIEAHVKSLLEGLVSGESNLPPLGRLGYALRLAYPNEINEGTFSRVLEQLEQIRAQQPQQPQQPGLPPQGRPMPQDMQMPDMPQQPQQPPREPPQ